MAGVCVPMASDQLSSPNLNMTKTLKHPVLHVMQMQICAVIPDWKVAGLCKAK